MLSVHKILSYRQKSEGGFVLIAALMAVMILMAVGFFILTTTSQDLRMSSRLVGERKAFSAAEAGVHILCLNLKPDPLLLAGTDGYQIVDAADPSGKYSYKRPVRNNDMPIVPVPGYDMAKAYVGAVFDTEVTGVDTSYGSSVTLSVGTAYTPNPSDTQQGNQ